MALPLRPTNPVLRNLLLLALAVTGVAVYVGTRPPPGPFLAPHSPAEDPVEAPEGEDFDGTSDELSMLWRREGRVYATKVNDLISRGMKEGWDDLGPDPQETRFRLARRVLNEIREANRTGEYQSLHVRFPPAFEPFTRWEETPVQGLPRVLLLEDGRIVVQVGRSSQKPTCELIDDTRLTRIPDALTFGRSADRRYFAIATPRGITVHDGWEGPQTVQFPWPSGLEGLPDGYSTKPSEQPFDITALVPFADGRRVLLANLQGVFVLTESGVTRLLPTTAELLQFLQRYKGTRPEDRTLFRVDMSHGAVSPDGRWIAAGHQSSAHFVFDAQTLEIAGEIGHLSEYPHYALFSADSSLIAFNSCHFYNGMTVGVPTDQLPGRVTPSFQSEPPLRLLQDGSRVYSGVARNDEFIVGDAEGFVRAFDRDGKFRWQHYLGGTIDAMDLNREGTRLVVTSFAGFLAILDLDTGKADPFAISTATHQERRRWLFWPGEKQPLIW